MVLTWDNFADRVTSRRTDPASCGTSYCSGVQSLLRQATGVDGALVSCDEYPFAAVEEGGGYLTTIPLNPTQNQKTCVPDWQQRLQSNCNSKFNDRAEDSSTPVANKLP
jgi:hypothetical protein